MWRAFRHYPRTGGSDCLVKAADAGIRKLASQEIASSPSTQEAKLALADAWYALGESAKGGTRDLCLLAAGRWYREAGPSLSGLLKLKVDKRLDEIAAVQKRRLAERQRPPSARHPQGKLWSGVL